MIGPRFKQKMARRGNQQAAAADSRDSHCQSGQQTDGRGADGRCAGPLAFGRIAPSSNMLRVALLLLVAAPLAAVAEEGGHRPPPPPPPPPPAPAPVPPTTATSKSPLVCATDEEFLHNMRYIQTICCDQLGEGCGQKWFPEQTCKHTLCAHAINRVHQDCAPF
eukprot:COSAG01_NODE_22281_length_862_cov_3.407602_1_plen_163_part_10